MSLRSLETCQICGMSHIDWDVVHQANAGICKVIRRLDNRIEGLELDRLKNRSDLDIPSNMVVRIRVPSTNLTFPGDQQLVIKQIAVPPQRHEAYDNLRVIVGDKVDYVAPVSYLIDSYPTGNIGPVLKLHEQIEQQLSVLLDKAQDQKLDANALEDLRLLHQDIWVNEPHLGVRVNIVIPPRQSFRIDVRPQKPEQEHRRYPFQVGGGGDDGESIDVYLGCYVERSVQ